MCINIIILYHNILCIINITCLGGGGEVYRFRIWTRNIVIYACSEQENAAGLQSRYSGVNNIIYCSERVYVLLSLLLNNNNGVLLLYGARDNNGVIIMTTITIICIIPDRGIIFRFIECVWRRRRRRLCRYIMAYVHQRGGDSCCSCAAAAVWLVCSCPRLSPRPLSTVYNNILIYRPNQ